MTADIIQADYETLEQIANRFLRQAELTQQMQNRLQNQIDHLTDTGWEGQAATAFRQEMEGELLPAWQRLHHALEASHHTTLQITQVLRTAEAEAAALFGTDIPAPEIVPTPTPRPNKDNNLIPPPKSENQLPPRPEPPPAPTEGDGSGKHGSKERNLIQQAWDEAQKQLWYQIANAADSAGMDDAARHMRHFLNNSGEDLSVSPEDILNDLPAFKEISQTAFQSDIVESVNNRIANDYKGESMRFSITSDWRNYGIGQPSYTNQLSNEGNWFYALGTFSYCYGADVIVTPDINGEPQVRIEYQMHVFDRYNWDAGKGVDIVGIPVPVPDTALGHLHQVGIAQEYEVWGSSESSTLTYVYPNNTVHDSPGIPGSGDQTRDDLINRDEYISRTDPRLDNPRRS
jgi:WXG100 family type VII secretion target